jgi:hypothetical protein
MNAMYDAEDIPPDDVFVCKTFPVEIEVKITNMPVMEGMNTGFLLTDDMAQVIMASLAIGLKEKLEEVLTQYVRDTIRLVVGKELKVEYKMDVVE